MSTIIEHTEKEPTVIGVEKKKTLVVTTNNATNSSFPLPAPLGGLGVASPTAHGVLIGEGAAAVNNVVLTAGQVLVGTTSGDPVGAAITGTNGIVVTNASGSVQISNSLGSWINQTTTTVTMAVNSSYQANNAALVTLTLPATAAFGSEFRVAGVGAGGWKIAQAAGQQINFGNVTTTSGTSGFLASTLANDGVWLVCTTANTQFQVFTGSIGNITFN
jgi:hypothetical protein